MEIEEQSQSTTRLQHHSRTSPRVGKSPLAYAAAPRGTLTYHLLYYERKVNTLMSLRFGDPTQSQKFLYRMDNANNSFRSAQRSMLSTSSPALSILSLLGFSFLAIHVIGFLRLLFSLCIFPGTSVGCISCSMTPKATVN